MFSHPEGGAEILSAEISDLYDPILLTPIDASCDTLNNLNLPTFLKLNFNVFIKR